MHEIILNLHMHTRYSDGGGLHADIAKAAINSHLDAVLVTDHNILVQGPEGYYQEGRKRVLLMIGEEIHDRTRRPQKNHLLVAGTNQELTRYAPDPQKLINAVRDSGGLCFIAHPVDPASPAFNEPDISWEHWDVHGFTGIELWNGFSEFKGALKSKLHAVFYAYFPQFIASAPYPETLQKWDTLLASGKRIVAVGGSDAHNTRRSLGALSRIIFPYRYHFKAINTHVLLDEALSGKAEADQKSILRALEKGHAYIGYDLSAPTRGFRFTAQGNHGKFIMGDEIPIKTGVTLQIRLPQRAECRLLKDGFPVKIWHRHDSCTYITTESGVYRVEVYKKFLGKRRAWIFSNPIYIRD